MNYRLLLVFVVALSLVSCRSKKSVLYFQNNDKLASQSCTDYELKIQRDDLLYIEVLGIDVETTKMFNNVDLMKDISVGNLSQSSSNSLNYFTNLKSYLVDSEGFIYFPVIGKLNVLNLTKTSLINLLNEKLSPYVTNPIVKVRFLNFKVTVLGQVNSQNTSGGPRTLTFDTEKVSLPQVLSQVGDLSIPWSSMENIVVVRDIDGVKTINRVDMTQADIINSPFYYLAQNDIIYIEPTKNKVNAAAVPTVLVNTGVILGITASILLILTSLK